MAKFINEKEKEIAIKNQIQVLYDFRKLKPKGRLDKDYLSGDDREDIVFKLLSVAETDVQLENLIRPVKRGEETLNHWIERRRSM